MFKAQSPLSAALGALLLLLSACAGAGARQTGEPTEDTPTSGATASGGPATNVIAMKDVPFESSSLNELGKLDVYAPSSGSGWPVLVMFHGNPLAIDKGYLKTHASRVAELGFVVFVPTWGHSGGSEYDALTVKQQLIADDAQATCAVAFAAEHAATYGGDPESLTVFGHSAGAMVGSVVVLAHPDLSDGCLASSSPQVDVFVPMEGDWLLTYPTWDALLADDPSIMEAITPWAHLPAPSDLRFVVLRSSNPGQGRSAPNAVGPDGWLAARDPDGEFTAALEANGALDEKLIDPAASDTILIQMLEEQGADVQLEILPNSSHESLSDAGWDVFLAAFSEIAGY